MMKKALAVLCLALLAAAFPQTSSAQSIEQFRALLQTVDPAPPTRLQDASYCQTGAPCAAATAASITLATAARPGDLLVAIFEAPTATISAVTTPTGWTAAASLNPIPTTAFQFYIYTRTATGTSGDNAATTWTGSSAGLQFYEAEFTHANTSAPIYGVTGGGANSFASLPIATNATKSRLFACNNTNSVGGANWPMFIDVSTGLAQANTLNCFSIVPIDQATFSTYAPNQNNTWWVVFGINHA